MALTREFRELVAARVQRDPAFAQALLCDAVSACLHGDLDAGKSLLRDFVNSTIGFEELGRRLAVPSKSLHRMLSRTGNPRSHTFFRMIVELGEVAGARIDASAAPVTRRRRRIAHAPTRARGSRRSARRQEA